jgi:hypothetical protein
MKTKQPQNSFIGDALFTAYHSSLKQLLFGLAFLVSLATCSDGDKSAINGMWQLKAIEDSTHHIQPVNTIFYSFQRQSIFSYTILFEKENQPATSIVIYGFVDFPAQDYLRIQLDKSYYKQASSVLWKDTSVVYKIICLDAKHLTLLQEQDKTFYYFNKY